MNKYAWYIDRLPEKASMIHNDITNAKHLDSRYLKDRSVSDFWKK